uniref:Carnosine N-methyltransferase-like isoform X3 n=1 Tax=Rhizophora mucronata TaxID=61149 RepID=A0A2P2MEC1_RHIMU
MKSPRPAAQVQHQELNRQEGSPWSDWGIENQALQE